MRILIFSDLPIPSGFGRISTYIARYLHYRGHDIRGAGLYYNGDPHPHPFHIFPLAGQDIWSRLTQIINTGVGDGWTPELVIASQDFPYLVSLLRDCPIDWSDKRFIGITPIDGTPVYKEWEAVARIADRIMVISRFGVEAMRQQGVQVDLCHPGVDTTEFWPATAEEKAALRAKAGIPADYWLYGHFSMNQGRKAIPDTLRGFWEFAKDKPKAALYLDMDETSPAGWNIGFLAQSMGIPTERILLKKQIQGALPSLRERYAILDAHGVLAYREGFGLPLLESMAMRLPTFAQDWCSGTEVVGDGKGYLVRIRRDSYGDPIQTPGTWGNANDALPDTRHFAELLNDCYSRPTEAAAVAERGYQWAIQQTWETTGKQVEDAIVRIYGPSALSHRGYLQPQLGGNSAHAAVPSEPHGDQRPEPGGDHHNRRLQPDMAADRMVWPADQGEPQRAEPGFRGELQPGREAGNGTVALVPEQRYIGADGLDAGVTGGDKAPSKRRAGAEAHIPPD